MLPDPKRHRSDYWLVPLNLTWEDKLQIENGSCLTDKHMNAVQKILDGQFPAIPGFQDTTLSMNGQFSAVGYGIQIHYVNGHWVTTVSEGESIQLFDSNFHVDNMLQLDTQLVDIYGYRKPVYLSYKSQQQVGNRDCGLFAIVSAYHAAIEDTTTCPFDQFSMRNHVIKGFEQGYFDSFPRMPREDRVPYRHPFARELFPQNF